MKILHIVESYYPSVGGSQAVVQELSERLASRGHEVHVATSSHPQRTPGPINGVTIHPFSVQGNEVFGIRGDTASYLSFLTNSSFDIVMCYAAQQWSFDLMKENLDKISGHRVFVPCGYSRLYDRGYRHYFSSLPGRLAKYDACVYMSHDYRDIRFAQEHGLTNDVFIPNGADLALSEGHPEAFRRSLDIDQGVPLILSVANYSYMKGQDRVLASFVAADISDTALVFIGSDLPSWRTPYGPMARIAPFVSRVLPKNKRVRFLSGLPRSMVVNAFAAADVFAFGSRLECSPLVLYEAAASATPFVSFGAGNAHEIATWTGAGIVVGSVPEMASAISMLVRDPQDRAAKGVRGQKAVRDRFNWDTIANEYEQLYQSLCRNDG